jgi:hypothetical protein
MDQQSSRRLLVLLGKLGQALTALLETRALGDCFVVATPDTSTLEERTAALQPTAVILEASEFSPEDRALGSRLLACSPGSRIVFLDVDRGARAPGMEAESGGRDFGIALSDPDQAGEGRRDLQSRAGPFRRPAQAPRARLESPGS